MKTFPKQVKRAAFTRADGHCEGCGAPLVMPFHYDHVIPVGLGGQSTLGNCALLCRPCHDAKTHVRDIPAIAKALRIIERSRAMRPSGKPLPGGRNSSVKKTISGQVVPRVSLAEWHRHYIAKRFGVQEDD